MASGEVSSVGRFTVARRSALQQQEGKSGMGRDLHLQEKGEVRVQICKKVLCSFVCGRRVSSLLSLSKSGYFWLSPFICI